MAAAKKKAKKAVIIVFNQPVPGRNAEAMMWVFIVLSYAFFMLVVSKYGS